MALLQMKQWSNSDEYVLIDNLTSSGLFMWPKVDSWNETKPKVHFIISTTQCYGYG